MTLNLDQISIAKPCSANWNEMSGDARVRHCGACKLNVYNLSELTRPEIEKLILEKEGKLCVRLYKREDGTVITQDCPVGLARIRRRMAVLSGALAASLFLAAGSVFARMGFKSLSGEAPAQAVQNWLAPQKPANPNLVVMGACPPMVSPVPKAVTPPTPTNSNPVNKAQ